MKRIASIIMMLAMLCCLSVTAFADSGSGSGGSIEIMPVVVGVIIGILIGVFIMLGHKSKLRSVKMQHAAANYIKRDSMKVTTSREIYLYKKVNRIPKNKDK